MNVFKFKPRASVALQFPAGVETEAVNVNGVLFLPAMDLSQMGGAAPVERKPEPSAAKPTESKPAAAKVKEEKPAKGETEYTESELQDMEVSELKKILKGYGVNPDDYDGKNSNKKLRKLVLQAQDGEIGASAKGSDDEDDDLPFDAGTSADKGAEHSQDTIDAVADELESLDSGKIKFPKFYKNIKEYIPGVDEDAVQTIIDKFEEDSSLAIDDVAVMLLDLAKGGGADDEKDEKPSRKRGAKKDAPKEKLTPIEDLEKGDNVKVWWDDDNQDWFIGTVKSVRRGKVTVEYEDGTSGELDPDVHTKIVLIED